MLPLLQCRLVGIVHFHRAERAAGAALTQPCLQAAGEAAEVRILAVAEGEYSVAEVVQRPRLAKHLALEGAGAVGGFAVAEGADHEQRAAGLAKVVFTQFGQGAHLYRHARCLQLPGALPGQLLGKAALAGKTDQPAFAAAIVAGNVASCLAHLALLAAAVEVQQPAGDEEQRHGQAGDGDDDAARQAEVFANVQGVDALQQLGLEGLVGVTVVVFHLSGGRVQHQGVEGAWVGGVVQQVEQVGRLAANRWQAQVVGGKARAGSVLEVGPDRVVVDH